MQRILIVEDDVLIAMLLEGWISDMGHEPVGPAYTLAHAQNLLDQPLNGAVIDLRLGEQSSISIIKSLADKRVPYIYATGDAELPPEPLPAAGLAIFKPYTFEIFASAVNQMLAFQAWPRQDRNHP